MLNKSLDSKGLTVEKLPHKIVVSLWLDNYDNIFSDFDPRSYLHRELSDDFLSEAKKISQEVAPGVMDLTILIPSGLRDNHSERIIKERLHSHFRKAAGRLEKAYKNLIRRGIVLVFAGICSSLLATLVSANAAGNGFLSHLLLVILEPAGWFCIWTGLDLIFFEGKNERENLRFNRKMAKAKIEFDSYAASA